MKCLILISMIFLSLISSADADDLFNYNRIDFFNSVVTNEKVRETASQENPETIVDEWAEPVISPSGKVSIYVPPKEVKDFLDKPDQENAKAYLKWNLKRIKKLVLAQELLAKEAKEIGFSEDAEALGTSSGLGSNVLMGNTSLKGNSLFYFMLKGCPACQREHEVIGNIYLNNPDVKIEAFADGFSDEELKKFPFPVKQDNGMSQILKVNSYPTIFVFNKKKERYLLSGYVDKEKILRLFE